MDLKALMNNDSSEAAKPAHQREVQHRSSSSIQPPPPPPLRTISGSYASPPPLQHRHNAQAPKPVPPLYQNAPSLDSRNSHGGLPSARLTPLHTPVHTPAQLPGAASAYPFPSGPFQSPSQAQQQYRGQDGHQVATPGGSRHSASSYQYPQQAASSPFGAPPQPPSAGLQHSGSHSSLSHTPQAVRESSIMSAQSYGHHQYPGQGQHASQPSTPLGPPAPIQYSRNLAQAQSPYNAHHRNSSGASHGPAHSVASNSPARPPGMSILAESPAMYGHGPGHASRPSQSGQPGPPKRVASGGYISETERERSLSVSPRTMVAPRQGSNASYYSNDVGSARNSMSVAQPEYDKMSHQPQPQPQQQAQQQHQQLQQQQQHQQQQHQQYQQQHEQTHLRSSDDMSHEISPLTTTRQAPIMHHPPTAPSPASRSSQTPKMKNLLNDTNIAPSPVRQSPAVAPIPAHSLQSSPYSQSQILNGVQPRNTQMTPVKAEPPTIKTEAAGFMKDSLLQQPVTAPASHHSQQGLPLKRAAETSPDAVHPSKRAKKIKYAEPPIWARFAASNPRYGDNPQSLAPPPQQQIKKPSPRPQVRPALLQTHSTNGHAPQPQSMVNGAPSGAPPSTPAATIVATSLPSSSIPPAVQERLGPWEVNIRNVQPMNDMLREVGDFLFQHATRSDVGTGDCVLEVEAKLGTLIDKETNCRVSTMGVTNTVLNHNLTQNGKFRFESNMTEVSCLVTCLTT